MGQGKAIQPVLGAHMSRPTQGFSLIELLIVLAILGVLTYAGASSISNQRGVAVRVMLDELEGSLLDAQRMAVNSGRDVAITSWGSVDVPSTMGLARGDSSLSAANIQATCTQIIASKLPTTDLGKSVAPLYVYTNGREARNAGIAMAGSTWWAHASSGNDPMTSVYPFKTDPTFVDAMTDSANLFQQGPAATMATISGLSGRFNGSFSIQVVGLRTGQPQAGAAQGMLIVLNGGAAIYKFYNPGIDQNDGKWRRI